MFLDETPTCMISFHQLYSQESESNYSTLQPVIQVDLNQHSNNRITLGTYASHQNNYYSYHNFKYYHDANLFF